jgi:uncharacterized protein (DUF849 family)
MNTKNKNNNKVIITCAITGAIHTPTMSPHLPITPDQITKEAIAAAEAGAAIYTSTQETHSQGSQTRRLKVLSLFYRASNKAQIRLSI